MSRFHDIRLAAGVARRLARGDRRAQESVYRAYSGVVYTMARRILRDGGLAEEVTQDTFVDMIEKAASLKRPEALASWLRAIAVNHCLMRLRSPWQRRQAASPALDGEPSGRLERERADAVEAAAETGTENAERAVDIDAALARLPADSRMVVWMHCVEGYTHREIGDAFGQTPSFSKSKLARAYRLLASHTACAEQPSRVSRQREQRREEPSNERTLARSAGNAAICTL